MNTFEFDECGRNSCRNGGTCRDTQAPTVTLLRHVHTHVHDLYSIDYFSGVIILPFTMLHFAFVLF